MVAAVALVAAAALISGFSMRNGIDPFDEGLMLQAARRVSAGQLPYRDFLWAYGPAQPYLLAGLFKLLGPSLLQWRIVRALADAGISLVAWLLVRDRTPAPLAGIVWLAVACEISEPRSADPFPLALLAVLVALLVASRCGRDRRGGPDRSGAAAAGLLVALAAAFRIDFALYGLVAVAVVLAARPGAGVGVAARFCLIAVVVGALVYLPFAIAIGPADLYRALIGNSLATRAYWTLPFPLHFHPPAGAGVAKTAKKALDFYVPVLVLIGFALTTAAALHAWWRARRPQPLALGLIVAGAGLLAYMTSRADAFHVQPAFVVVAVALGLVAGRRPPVRAGVRPSRTLPGGLTNLPHGTLGAAAAVLLAALTLHGVANRLSALVHPAAAATLRIPVADGVQAPPAEARAIDRMVGLVDARTRPGQPIYVLPRRPDLVTFNDPLIYVLTQRPNPTSQDFGLEAGAAAQARIVATLSRVRPRVIVRWTDPLSSTPEPNQRGRPTGVHTLNRWVAAHYRVLARLYHYTVLVPR
ncbi:MAG: hypothetical protein ACRDMX_10745 [Solirubrobacteraceae bacterium]